MSIFKIESNFISLLVIGSFFFQELYIDIGFAFKPYMYVSLILFFPLLKQTRQTRINENEFILIAIILWSCLGVIYNNQLNLTSIRFLAGSILFLISYIIYRGFFEKKVNTFSLIINVSLVYLVLTLAYYFYGISQLIGVELLNGDISHGVLYDRGMFRLKGFNNNPDYFNLFNIIFLSIGLNKWKINFKMKLILVFSILCGILTFSLSALLVNCIIVLLFIISLSKQKILITTLSISVLIFIIFNYFNHNDNEAIQVIKEIVIKRTEHSKTGSGRFEMWNGILPVISDNLIIGTGVGTVYSYTYKQFSIINLHNTYLEILLELGIVGLLLFLFLLLINFLKIINYSSNKTNKSIMLLSFIGLTISLFSVSAQIHEALLLNLLIITAFTQNQKNEN